MNKEYSKFLGSKLFLIEQIATQCLNEKDENILRNKMKEILDITSGSYEDIKEKMERQRK